MRAFPAKIRGRELQFDAVLVNGASGDRQTAFDQACDDPMIAERLRGVFGRDHLGDELFDALAQ